MDAREDTRPSAIGSILLGTSGERDDMESTIATLGAGPASATCSMAVARRVYPKAKLLGCPTFEAAISLVLTERADRALVPGAYPNIRYFLMHDDLIVEQAFQHTIPALVLVVKPEGAPEVGPLFYHPATKSLHQKIDVLFETAVECLSNENAVERLRQSTQPAAAVTNELAADAAELSIRQVLRVAKPMTWTLFGPMRGAGPSSREGVN